MHPKDHPVALADRLQGLSLYLVGMMGCGKSHVGPALASRLGYRFVDLDSVISAAAGRSIAAIFAAEGEAGFRQLERQVLLQVASWHSLVVATGGGVVTTPANWGELRQGLVVWLDVPAATLLERLQADPTPRPLLADADPAARLEQLLLQRQPLYSQADLHIAAGDGDASAIAERVLAALPGVLREPPTTSGPSRTGG
ncbi:MAG: shikimate kinase [Synechococcus sp.]